MSDPSGRRPFASGAPPMSRREGARRDFVFGPIAPIAAFWRCSHIGETSVFVVPYNPDWEIAFGREAKAIRGSLPDTKQGGRAQLHPLVIASGAKQSRVPPRKDSGLLRSARNDDVGAAPRRTGRAKRNHHRQPNSSTTTTAVTPGPDDGFRFALPILRSSRGEFALTRKPTMEPQATVANPATTGQNGGLLA